ncbi:MAG: hypothetical protein EZS28_019661 [Streblomastix strix]|uniref:Tyr recombinase domain-containing protein n=1 Tax=Streblomastix strix TaxID=222440 RepID=A0A5J4VQC1_9EUKA|nr:MAG: hypothetical protein EZS28_019661 [Streblomastix strix]
MTWLTKTRNTKLSLAKHYAQIFNTQLFLIFGTVNISATVQSLTAHAISNHQINNPRYGSTWDINQSFVYWRERPESKLLSNEELQIKLASLLMSLCLVRIEEMANIDLSVSIIDDEEQRAAVCIPSKQSTQRQRYDLRGTVDATNIFNVVGTTSYTFSVTMNGNKQIKDTQAIILRNLYMHQDTRICWENNKYLHAQHTRFKDEPGVLCVCGEQIARFLNLCTRKESRREAGRTSYLNYLKKKSDASVSDGDVLQQSPQGDDLQLFPQGTLAPPLCLLMISTQPIVEARSPNDRESTRGQESQIQKDDQDVKPQEEAQNSSMTMNTDQARTANPRI